MQPISPERRPRALVHGCITSLSYLSPLHLKPGRSGAGSRVDSCNVFTTCPTPLPREHRDGRAGPLPCARSRSGLAAGRLDRQLPAETGPGRPSGHIFERGVRSLSRALSWTASISARWQASQVRRWMRNAAARSESSSPSAKAMRSSHGVVGSGIRLGDSTIPHMSDLASGIGSLSGPRPLQAHGGVTPPATSTLTRLPMFSRLHRKKRPGPRVVWTV